jgi:hypothetical protein
MNCRLDFKIPGLATCGIGLGLSLACGEITTPVNPGVGGSSGGAGGRAGTAGAAGTVPMGGAQSLLDGGAMLDAGGVAGSGGAGSGGTGTISGCPEPTPIAAIPEQTIVIQSVHFGRSEVVLKNISPVEQTLAGGRRGWQWCNVPDYWNIKLTEEDIVLGPGETYKFRLIREDGRVRTLYGEDPAEVNEVAIYNTTGSFMSAELIEAFVSWSGGSGQGTRDNVASAAGIWVFDSHIEISPGHAGFIATGNAISGEGFTSVPARCLPADP